MVNYYIDMWLQRPQLLDKLFSPTSEEARLNVQQKDQETLDNMKALMVKGT